MHLKRLLEICLASVLLCCSPVLIHCAPARPSLNRGVAHENDLPGQVSAAGRHKRDTFKLPPLRKKADSVTSDGMMENLPAILSENNRAESSDWLEEPAIPPQPKMTHSLQMSNMLNMPAWDGVNLSIDDLDKLIEALSTIRHFLIVQKQAIVHEGGRGLVPHSFKKRTGETANGIDFSLSGNGHRERRRKGPEFATNGW